jgi:hypothetical protein
MIIGPIFFNETITAERYQELIMNFLFFWEVGEQDYWYQQDGATPHICQFSNADLERVFRWSHYFSKLVAPSIPGSIATGFLSLGVFEGERVKNIPHTSDELKQNIELCISNVTPAVLHRVAPKTRERVNACIAERGGHFQHLTQRCFLFSDFNVFYFLTRRICVRSGLRDFSITLYNEGLHIKQI